MIRLPWGAGLVLLAGCAPEPRPAVWVDLSRAPVLPPLPAPDRAPARPGLPKRTVELPPLAASAVRARPGTDATSLAAELRISQERARRRLAERLRRLSDEEVNAFRAAETVKLNAAARARALAREEAFRARFERYARDRSGLAVELALLAGFPDPGRTPDDVPERFRVRRLQLARAEEIRTELARLEKAFRADTERLVADDDSLDASARGELLLRLEKRRAELERIADEDAARQVPLDTNRLPGRRVASGDVRLPAVPSRVATLAGVAPVPAWNELGGNGVASATANARAIARERDRRDELASHLRIFLAERGFTLRKGARDVTADFFRWRSLFRTDGFSPNSPPSSAGPSSGAIPTPASSARPRRG